MSDIIFNCPNCVCELAIDPAGAGLQIECPNCSKTITVPTPSGYRPPPPNALRRDGLKAQKTERFTPIQEPPAQAAKTAAERALEEEARIAMERQAARPHGAVDQSISLHKVIVYSGLALAFCYAIFVNVREMQLARIDF